MNYESEENKNEIKRHLLDYVKEITEPSMNGSKNQYICPLCKSGTGKNRSGAFTVYPETNSYHCFACGTSGDIFKLYGAINNIIDFKDIIKELESKYNILSSQPANKKK